MFHFSVLIIFLSRFGPRHRHNTIIISHSSAPPVLLGFKTAKGILLYHHAPHKSYNSLLLKIFMYS